MKGSPGRTLGCTQENSDPGGLTAPQLDGRPRHKIFSFIDTSQNNNEDSVKNPDQGNAGGVRDSSGEGSAQARKL